MLLIELDVGPDWGKPQKWQERCELAANAAIKASTYGDLTNQAFCVEISIKFSGNDEVQQLNASYRGKDKPTNILSFPLVQPDLLSSLSNTDDGEILLGDIILAYGVCAKEAAEKDISFTDHATHLIVHGILHLLGYDHEGEADALIMEDLEVQALSTLGISNPYADEIDRRIT